jgi:hypothetical protein
MCMMSTPKTPDTTAKPVEYLHNQYLDGYTIGSAQTRGRNSLRVDLASPTGSGVQTAPAPSGTPAPKTTSPIPGAPVNPTTPVRSGPITLGPGIVSPTVGGALAGTIPGMRTR